MSQAFIESAQTTLWFRDEALAIWLRIVCLNLEHSAIELNEWQEEMRIDWLHQSDLVGVSNAIGIDLDQYLTTPSRVSAFRTTCVKVQTLLQNAGDLVPSHCLRLLGFHGNGSIDISTTELLDIGQQILQLVNARLDSLKN